MLMKIKMLWKKYKRDVIIGIVVSLATAVIIQAGDWFVMTAPTMGNSLIGTVKNCVFASAATQSSLRILSTIISYALGVFISYCLVPTINCISLLREEKKIERIKNLFGTVHPDNTELEKKTRLELLKLSRDFIDNGETSNKMGSKELKVMIILLTFIVLFLVIYVFLFLIIPLGLVNKFQCDIIAITPYSDNTTIQCLESDWVCMRSENEYKEIYIVINEIKQEYNLP